LRDLGLHGGDDGAALSIAATSSRVSGARSVEDATRPAVRACAG
jgi:hypothetical protein